MNLKASSKAVKTYYSELASLNTIGATHEGAVSPAFASLLRSCAHQYGQTLVEKQAMKVDRGTIFVDGAIVDSLNYPYGFWEAKDTDDDLDREIKKKFDVGYPKNNILFQAPDRIVIWQDKQKVFDENTSKPEHLIEGLKFFFEYEAPAYKDWQIAVEEFKPKVQEAATVLLELIEKERQTNKVFIQAFEDFVQLCHETINPNISVGAVEEMLIQHLLTERIFRRVFRTPDFVERNVIAHEIEKVISALMAQSFSRNEFLKPLDHFYDAIEKAADTIDDFSQKQGFLNTVYEKFFQGFSVKVADTHGIVYTPQQIVKFMVKSVEHILQEEFGRSLSDEGVHIIDPFVGTGNFILWVMREIQRSKLPFKYANELHCNEVMLLPYYIASMNIEHEYYEATGRYDPFKGICFVDTFDLSQVKQLTLFTKKNTERAKLQQTSPIFVVIGNPPYNTKQVNENDNNKNRKYPIDKDISNTYAKDSKATNKNQLSDPYVKAIYWATQRIGEEGIVALVTNNSYIEKFAFDGMRKHLEDDFDYIYIMDLGGNVRENPKLSGTTHNVFGIQVGVSINLFLKKKGTLKEKPKIYYARLDEYWRKLQKYDFLEEKVQSGNIEWKEIKPDVKHTWLTEGLQDEFNSFIPIGTKEAKAGKGEAIFQNYGRGVATCRDAWVYNFNPNYVAKNVQKTIEVYNEHVYKLSNTKIKTNIDDFVLNDDTKISWSEGLKNYLRRKISIEYDSTELKRSIYRPFTSMNLYYDKYLNERRYQIPSIFPVASSEYENHIICTSGIGSSKPFQTLMLNTIPCLDMLEKTQCFPLYTYSEDGTNRQENITDWALQEFRKHYEDDTISKQDIFYYTYGILHHPQYREKYAANLKRELPRIPFSPDFRGLAEAGKRLAEIHVNYENQAEYPFKWIEDIDAKVHYRVERMKLSKDKTQIIYNDFVTLGGIPPEVFEYRLGNRSALEWIIDQYRVKTDKRSGITNDPNNLDDPQYIIRLIGKVITVSLETMKIVKSLPGLE